jgi:hypothetical protein
VDRVDRSTATVRNGPRVARRMATRRAIVNDIFCLILPVREIGEGHRRAALRSSAAGLSRSGARRRRPSISDQRESAALALVFLIALALWQKGEPMRAVEVSDERRHGAALEIY